MIMKNDLEAGTRGDMRDAVAHRAAANNADCLDFA